MASAYRLPAHVRPERYRIALELDPERSRRYRGTLRVELVLARATDVIELHAADLELRGAVIEQDGRRSKARVEALPDDEAVRVHAKQTLAKGRAVLELRFSGRLRDDLRGLYLARSGKRRYAVSQLEPADARRFFPCFDEPSFKARFALEVVTSSRHTVISNGRKLAVERLARGRQRVRFAETPKLSTYLVALAVGDLRASRAVWLDATEIRVYHVPGQARLTGFALRSARACLARLRAYFGVPYPYDKLDLVAVPDFDMGAMENAGAVFFRETLLLIDERRAALAEKKRVLEVICHELAHMWYGNLVTMAWWDDLWLNEAFATWMAFEIVDQYRPELRMWNDFGHSRDSALGLDALANTHAVYARVRTPAEAAQSFDLITYEKGASVIRMLERYLGPARFRRGVREYIRSHREGNARAADLWRALERHAGEAVASVVRPWIERAGFPLVRVRKERAAAGAVLSLEQERFSARGPRIAPGKPWPVPVVVKVGVGRGERSVRQLLAGRRARLRLPNGARFAYANADEGGFYRPLHDASLLGPLHDSVTELSAAERLGFLSHSFALVRAGYAPLGDFLALCKALRAESDPDVLEAIFAALASVLDRVARPASASTARALRKYVASIFAPALRKLGLHARHKQPERTRLRRAELLALCGVLAEDEAIAAEAEPLLERYLAAPHSLEPNLAGPLVVIGARSATRERHRRYFARSRDAATPQERRRFRLALGEMRDPDCIERTLALCVRGAIPTQDVALVLARMIENPSARDATWRFLRKRWSELGRRMPQTLVGRVIEATPALGSERHRRELASFFARHPVPAAARALRQADERFRLDAAWRKRAIPELEHFLAARA